MSCVAFIVSVWLNWMLSFVFLSVFLFSLNLGLLVFMSCLNYVIEKKRRAQELTQEYFNFKITKICDFLFIDEFFLRNTPLDQTGWFLEENFEICVRNANNILKACVHYFLFFRQMISLQKLWKMHFISSKKLFSFSGYSNFCSFIFPSFAPCRPLL